MSTFQTAVSLYENNKLQEAVLICQQILRREKCADCLNLLGAICLKIKKFQLAIDYFNQAIELQLQRAIFYSNRGNAYENLSQYALAQQDYEMALSLRTDSYKIYNNLGGVLRQMGEFDKALEMYNKAIAIDSSDVTVYSNRGVVHLALHHFDFAISDFRHVFKKSPQYLVAQWNLAICLLTLGRLDLGWYGYEFREKASEEFDQVDHYYNKYVLWSGNESLDGKTILLYSEEGVGDILQICRYLPLLKHSGANLVIAVEKSLFSILASLEGISLEEDIFVEKFSALSKSIEINFRCPMMSLPLRFKTFSVAQIPQKIPYLFASTEKVHYWGRKLGVKHKPRIGLVWNGGFRPNQSELWGVNQRRNIDFSLISQLGSLEKFDFYSLQKGEPAESELLKIKDTYWQTNNFHILTEEIQDWTDTAGLIYHLDLIISVDTSTAHLAGAMGKPVWLLNRFDTCWRWLLDRTDSPWYPGLRIFRQAQHKNWQYVIAEVMTALEDFIPHTTIEIKPKDYPFQTYISSALQEKTYCEDLFDKARLAYQNEEYQSAKDQCLTLLELDEYHINSLKLLAVCLYQLRDFEQAIFYFQRLLPLKTEADIHFYYALTLKELNQHWSAIAQLQKVIQIDPLYILAYRELPDLLKQINPIQVKIYFEWIIFLAPRCEDIYFEYARFLKDRGEYESALQLINHAITLFPERAFLLVVRADILYTLNRFVVALNDVDFDFSLLLTDIEKVFALRERSLILMQLNQLDKAVIDIKQAMEITPDDADLLFSLSVIYLKQGRLREGWLLFESRWQLQRFQSEFKDKLSLIPMWGGNEILHGKTILIYGEQGIGDNLQFCRYLPMLKQMGGKIVFWVGGILHTLLASLPGLRLGVDYFLIPHADISDVEKLPLHYEIDYRCPLLSLPLACQTFYLRDIPSSIPYLFTPFQKIQFWRDKLGPKHKLRIGLIWSGGLHANQIEWVGINKLRNIEFSIISQFSTIQQFDFYSLQKGEPVETELRRMKDMYWRENNFHILTQEIEDFSDTAGLIYHLDLIIGVDTSVIHLAGAMGKPVWLLNRFSGCWRWLENREDSPWYPTLRIFQQKQLGDWDEVISRVKLALLEWVEKPFASDLPIVENAFQQGVIDKFASSQLIEQKWAMTLQEVTEVYKAGRIARARQKCEILLNERPEDLDFLNVLALCHIQEGNGRLALEIFTRMIGLQPNNNQLYHNLGLLYVALNQRDQAIENFHQSLRLNPQFWDTHWQLGELYASLKQFDQALFYYQVLVEQKKDNALPYFRCGSIYKELGQFELSLSYLQEFIQRTPSSFEAYYECGLIYRHTYQLPEALRCFQQALNLAEDNIPILFNMANILIQLHQVELAIQYLEKVRSVYPDNAEVLLSLAFAYLSLGNFDQGWHYYGARRGIFSDIDHLDFSVIPLWLGEISLKNKTILIYGEQADGDTLQFCRYLTQVKRLGARIVFLVEKPLVTLLSSLSTFDFTQDLIITTDDPLPKLDYRCPLLSLPLACKTFSLSAVPKDIPYLFASQTKIAYWRDKLGKKTKPRIGLVWDGTDNRLIGLDQRLIHKKHDISFAFLADLNHADSDFYSLQKGGIAESNLAMEKFIYWETDNFHILMQATLDFHDTAGLISQLDLVIGVDSPVIHLAGAMGKPVWLLNRFDTCWRWLLDGENSPWYPTMRIFRQESFGDWHGVIKDVKLALDQFIKEYCLKDS